MSKLPEGSFVDKDNKIVKCYTGCKTCLSTSGFSCTTCFKGYAFKSSNCLKCSQNCEECAIKNNQNKCTKCATGFYYNTTNNSCVSVKTCRIGTWGDSIERSCKACTSPCETCEKSSTTCNSCVLKFYQSGNQCLSCRPPCDPSKLKAKLEHARGGLNIFSLTFNKLVPI